MVFRRRRGSVALIGRVRAIGFLSAIRILMIFRCRVAMWLYVLETFLATALHCLAPLWKILQYLQSWQIVIYSNLCKHEHGFYLCATIYFAVYHMLFIYLKLAIGVKILFEGRCWSKNCFAHFSTHSFHCTFIMISVKKYGKKTK